VGNGPEKKWNAMIWVCWIRSLLSDVRAYQASAVAGSESPLATRKAKQVMDRRDAVRAAFKARSQSAVRPDSSDDQEEDAAAKRLSGQAADFVDARRSRERLRSGPRPRRSQSSTVSTHRTSVILDPSTGRVLILSETTTTTTSSPRRGRLPEREESRRSVHFCDASDRKTSR